MGEAKGAKQWFSDGIYSPLMAELSAIMEGIKFAEALGCRRLEIESDCLQAINLILGKSESW